MGIGNTDLIDELLVPDYMNLRIGVNNRAGFKAVISGLKASMPARDFEIVDLVAEGDSVVFRGNMNVTLASGKKVSARDPITVSLTGRSWKMNRQVPRLLTELLADMMPPKSGS